MLLLGTVSLAPFMIMMVTSFSKIVIIINLVRNALGVQQIPPNIVVNGLALILSIYVMNPVLTETFSLIEQQNFASKNITQTLESAATIAGPIKKFLAKHSTDRQKRFFVQTTKIMWAPEQSQKVQMDDFMVLMPAFIVSELTSAFQIGFLIYLPFIAVDLIVSNILLALGMMMVSPMTISLPFKILLFVLIEGWSNLIQGIILTYK